ncbi:MAG TPA: hypothetical protein PLR06_14010, partial [Cyclobacteriaceae bacterium]|nr:hypothetical protein [Cyclobacteriaceae bacterium]
LAADSQYTLAVKTDGTLWAWGANGNGQLGDGTTVDKSAPASIGSGYVKVAAGLNRSFALKSDGTLWAWGENGIGQLGDGTTENKSTPVLIAPR